eukprot:3918307-Prymnesium_polylepis.1
MEEEERLLELLREHGRMYTVIAPLVNRSTTQVMIHCRSASFKRLLDDTSIPIAVQAEVPVQEGLGAT